MLTPSSPNTCPSQRVEGKRRREAGWLYIQPETQMPFRHACLTVLIKQVHAHRFGLPEMKMDLGEGWEDRLKDDICQQNDWIACIEVYNRDTHPLVLEGRERWRELHQYASDYPDNPTSEDVEKAKEWLAGWRSRIPNYPSCRCRENFADIEARNPFRLSSRAEFWTSTVENHDYVSIKLRRIPQNTPLPPR
jgi:hypothetical protein